MHYPASVERTRPIQRPHCPLCREDLEDQALELRACPGCQTDYHALCMDELGGCSVLGCSHRGEASGPEGADEPRLPPERLEEVRRHVAEANAAWADMIREHTRITVHRDPVQTVLRLHPGLRQWSVASLVFAAIAISGVLVWHQQHDLLANASLWVVLSLLFGYPALASVRNRIELRVDRNFVKCSSGPLPWPGDSSFVRSRVVDVDVRLHASAVGDTPRRRLVLVLQHPTEVVAILPHFVSEEAPKRYLQAQLREALGIVPDGPTLKG